MCGWLFLRNSVLLRWLLHQFFYTLCLSEFNFQHAMLCFLAEPHFLTRCLTILHCKFQEKKIHRVTHLDLLGRKRKPILHPSQHSFASAPTATLF